MGWNKEIFGREGPAESRVVLHIVFHMPMRGKVSRRAGCGGNNLIWGMLGFGESEPPPHSAARQILGTKVASALSPPSTFDGRMNDMYIKH